MADSKSRRERAAEIAEGTRQENTSLDSGGKFVASPEAKKQALIFRIIAIVLWVAAIAIEIYVIWKILLADLASDRFGLLIGLVVAIAVLAIGGNLLWKQANRLDPASKNDTVRFFVQNQLGAIIAIIAFLPLIVLIFTDKNLDGKQKGILGGLAVVLAAAAVWTGVDTNAPSQEQYSVEQNVVSALTGVNQVWYSTSPGSKVFHVCEKAAEITGRVDLANMASGTVAEAHAAGKERLDKRWPGEARNHCGVPEERIQAVLNGDTGLTSGELSDTVDDQSVINAPETAKVPSTTAPASTPAPEPVPAG